MLQNAWYIAKSDVRFMLRKRETLMWVFIMPILFFAFFGAIGNGMGGGEQRDRIVVSAGADGGVLAERVEQRLTRLDYDVVHPEAGPAPDEELFLELPPGFTRSVLDGEKATVRFTSRKEGLDADAHRFRVQRAVYSVLADVVACTEGGRDVDAASFAELDARPHSLELAVSSAGKRVIPPSGREQSIPGTMVMFTLIVLLTSGAVLVVIERREGIVRRLACAPLSRGEIVLGKWGGRMALGLVQLAFACLIGRVVFGVHWWPDPLMIAAILVAWAALAAALSLLLGSLARTEGQAIAIGVLASNVLAALGGCWWPIEVTPRWMQQLSLCLPTGWTMDALHRLMHFAQGASSALPHLAALCAAALLAGWAASRVFRFQ